MQFLDERVFDDESINARDVKDNDLSDLSSDAGERISRELEDPGPPSLPEVHDEFLELCDKLGVK